jgi:hypothetical protein
MMEVDPRVFGDTGDGSNEHVILVDASDRAAAARALALAGARFTTVTEDGRELTDDDDIEELGDVYTPNYVSDVRMAARGPWCYVDCKGYIDPPMRERMLAILAEELDRAGVRARAEVPADDEMDYDTPPV